MDQKFDLKAELRDWNINSIKGDSEYTLFHIHSDANYWKFRCIKTPTAGWTCLNCDTKAPKEIQYIADLCKCKTHKNISKFFVDMVHINDIDKK